LSTAEYNRLRSIYDPLAESVRALVDATIRTTEDPETLAAVKKDIDAAVQRLRRNQIDGTFGETLIANGATANWGNAVRGIRNAVAPPVFSQMDEAGRVLEMTSALVEKFAGKPFALIGVNNDPVENLREMQKQPNLVTFPNFSDPNNLLANEYRIGSWPLVYVLDGERKIAYAGPPGSFVELTASALLDPAKPAVGK
jgi:hypothetical protein